MTVNPAMTKNETPLATSLDPGLTLIEASAGSGKTRAITTLIARLVVEQDHKIDSILVVTFTKAATAELGARIRRVFKALQDGIDGEGEAADDQAAELLRKWRAGGEPAEAEISARIRAALLDIDTANVRTIHGFCQRALGEFALETGFPFGFDLEGDGSAVRESVVRRMWQEKFLRSSKFAAQCLNQRNFMPKPLAGWYRNLRTKPDLELSGFPEHAVNFPVAEGAFMRTLQATRSMWGKHGTDFAQTMRNSDALNRSIYQRSTAQSKLQQIESQLFDDNRLPEIKGLRELAVYFGAKKLYKSLKAGKSAPDNPLFAVFDTLVIACDDLERTLTEWLIETRREVYEQAGGQIALRVRELRRLGFDDLLVEMRGALMGGGGRAIAESLRRRYPVALIDESQDTDPMQAEIFRGIYLRPEIDDDAALYIVGDPKQSIYEFRGADIFAYLSIHREAKKQLRLGANYRSAPELVRAVNAIFAAPLAFTLPELNFENAEPGREEPGLEMPGLENKAALELDTAANALLDNKPLQIRLAPDQKTNSGAESFFVEHMAGDIASLLRQAGEGGAKLEGKPLRARDIAVLVRTHVEGSAITRALRKRGVNCVESAQPSVFRSREAEQLHWLLQALVNPGRQDLRRAALTADVFGLDPAELLALGEDDEIWSAWGEKRDQMRELWRGGGVGAMLLGILADGGSEEGAAGRNRRELDCAGARNLLRFADGPRRFTNLRHLAEILQHTETENRLDPAGLAAWFARERSRDEDDGKDDEARQLRLESDEDLVRILTVHGSKGLEFPIVYLPFAWHGKSLTTPKPPTDQPTSYHKHADGRFPAVLAAAPDDAERRRAELEEFGESVRLLYVGLTRARERCVVGLTRVGVVMDKDKNSKKAKNSENKHLPALSWLLQRNEDHQQALEALRGGVRSDFAVSDEFIKVYDAVRHRYVNSGARTEFNWLVRLLAQKCPERCKHQGIRGKERRSRNRIKNRNKNTARSRGGSPRRCRQHRAQMPRIWSEARAAAANDKLLRFDRRPRQRIRAQPAA